MMNSFKPADSNSVAKDNIFTISRGSIVLLTMMCTSFIAHPSAISFYEQLESKSISSFVSVVAAAFGFASVIYASMMSGGYSLFGKSSQGLILSNLHDQDFFGQVAKVATGVSIIGSYPFLFSAFKGSLLRFDALKDIPNLAITTAGLALATLVATTISNVGLLASFTSALLSPGIAFILPSVFYIQVSYSNIFAMS